jgi:hypothetical protein
MALTEDDTVFFRVKLGSGTDLADAESRLDRLGDRRAVVLEVLEERLATLVATPASFSVAGEYSQDTKENIRQVERSITDARAELETGGDVDLGLVRIQAPAPYGNPRVYDTEESVVRGLRLGGR